MTFTSARSFRWLATLSLGCWLPASTLAAEPKPLEYNRDIRPILSENCFACHGPDSAARKAELRLDQRQAAVDSNAFVPGKPDESDLVRRIFSTKADELMPPAASHKKLTAEQKETLKRWIAAGAKYQPHWSLIAPKRPAPPTIKNPAWAKNPIDQFIAAEHDKRGLTPADAADRRTLARRVSLDLTGLPPAPDIVEAFVNDKDANAYEKLIDKLLATPQWGEHRTRYWLDAARYADTHGIHFDNYREMWSYREWLIRAYNQNMKFDQFTIEQLAGDLLPNRTLDQQLASGFNRCNMTTNEGGAIDEEYLVLYTRDRTETTSQVFMGLTVGCAVCHDHKFDPVSQKEFYSLAAFFNNTTQRAMDQNIKDTPPFVPVPKMEDRDRWTALEKETNDARLAVEARKNAARPDFDRWLAEAKPDMVAGTMPSDGLRLYAPLSEGQGGSLKFTQEGQAKSLEIASLAWEAGYVANHALKMQQNLNVQFDEAGDLEKDQGFSYGAWIKLNDKNQTGAIFARMDEDDNYRGWDLWLEGGRIGAHIIAKWPDDAIKTVANTPLARNKWQHVFVTYDGSAKVEGIKIYVDGKLQPSTPQARNLKSTIRTKTPLKLGQRSKASRLDDIALHELRVYGRALPPTEIEQLAQGGRAALLAAKPADKRTDAEKNEVYGWWLAALDAPYKELSGKHTALVGEQNAIKARGTIAHVMQEKKEPAMAYVLFRGDYDKRRDQVKPATPAALPPFPDDLPKNRLGLAQWLLRPEHPLTARVAVNRMWQELFGVGLVRTSGDFGVTGEMPSHPELLDWLAIEFRDGGWDIKKQYKLMVMSATYQQAAITTPEKKEKDRDNRLLSRGPRFRMDAEMVRDYALSVSGLLVPKLGGRSVKPYQPEGVWEAVAMIGSDTRDYRRDTGENLYRRSMYTFWKRAAPPASMEILNAPNREQCATARERTNTPLQALVTLNDVQFVEAARHVATKVLKTGGDDAAKIDVLARLLLSRPLRAEEHEIVAGSLKDLLAHYQADAKAAGELVAVGESKRDESLNVTELAAWTMLTNQLMNLDEVLCK